jgi:tRNA threonylcarbamoyladenosine biosynthesis protein TsaB
MIQLLIETSTERALVALVKEGELLFHADLPFGYQHSRHLLPTLDRGLREQRLTMRDMGAVVVGVGPGSYTGLRVGAMTAKALAFASEVPLVGICTLHTFIPSSAATFAVLIDAKIGGAYIAIEGGPPQVCPLEELGVRLEGIQRLVTPNAAALQVKLAQLYPGNSWQWEEAAPNPLQLARLAVGKLDRGEFSLDGDLDLLYLREQKKGSG